jgi:tRNA(Ile)-lysidine synthase
VAGLPAGLARRVVRSWLTGNGIAAPTAAHVERVLRAAGRSPGVTLVLPGRRVQRRGEALVCEVGPDPVIAAVCASIVPGGAVDGPTWRLAMSEARDWTSGESPRRDAYEAVFDAEALAGPLEVRTLRPGDRIHVPAVGTRKLQDVLVDRKVPRPRRAGLPVLTAGAVVVWVPGVVRSSAARVGEGTRRVIEVRLVTDDKLALPLTKPRGNFAGREERSERGRIE